MDSYKILSGSIITVLLLLTYSTSISAQAVTNQIVQTGTDILLAEQFELVKNKQLGIITNQTATLSNGIHLVDTLFSREDVEIVSLFGPEHGIRGNNPDGHSIENGFDIKTGLPVYSLYGNNRKPTKETLESVNLLLFDIQDIGARFYTFISTMYYAIQTSAENNIPIIVLDRPNPINGINVEGPVLDPKFKSFVGIAEIPLRHGMTVGELAQFFNRPDILRTDEKANLTVVKMKWWDRNFYFDDCELPWTKPSPNMPNLETAIVYPGQCLLEGTNISEGRGTNSPFLQIGSPFIIPDEVISELNLIGIIGCRIEKTIFTPVEIPNMSKYPKYKNQKCYGLKICSIDKSSFDPIDFSLNLIYVFNKLYPEKFSFNEGRIDKLWGSENLRLAITKGETPKEIKLKYQKKLDEFIKIRKQYLLY